MKEKDVNSFPYILMLYGSAVVYKRFVSRWWVEHVLMPVSLYGGFFVKDKIYKRTVWF